MRIWIAWSSRQLLTALEKDFYDKLAEVDRLKREVAIAEANLHQSVERLLDLQQRRTDPLWWWFYGTVAFVLIASCVGAYLWVAAPPPADATIKQEAK